MDAMQLRRREALVHLPQSGVWPEGDRPFRTRALLQCRRWCDLVHQSQQDNKVYCALHRAQKIRERLGGRANMMNPFAEKPKGMPWSTYERLRLEHHEAEMEQLAARWEWLEKFEKNVG
jgi:hypothetical protein